MIFRFLRFQHTLSQKSLLKILLTDARSILILEEGAPVVEESLRGILDNGIKFMEGLTELFPAMEN